MVAGKDSLWVRTDELSAVTCPHRFMEASKEELVEKYVPSVSLVVPAFFSSPSSHPMIPIPRSQDHYSQTTLQ